MTDPGTAGEQAAPSVKSRSMLPVILASAFLAAAGAGAGVYFLTGAGVGHESPAQKQEAGKPRAPAIYVEFDPPFVVNFDAKGVMRFLQVSVKAMTRDPATAELIKQHDPVMRNDLLLLLGSQTIDTISTREGKEKLRQEALETVAKIVAREGGDPKKVEDLYFTSFVMQ
ncbi:MAG TPA: flagellar basal body-associated FliL family protein [Steroidobacter sp.]